jgi:hypothetical protein
LINSQWPRGKKRQYRGAQWAEYAFAVDNDLILLGDPIAPAKPTIDGDNQKVFEIIKDIICRVKPSILRKIGLWNLGFLNATKSNSAEAAFSWAFLDFEMISRSPIFLCNVWDAQS